MTDLRLERPAFNKSWLVPRFVSKVHSGAVCRDIHCPGFLSFPHICREKLARQTEWHSTIRPPNPGEDNNAEGRLPCSVSTEGYILRRSCFWGWARATDDQVSTAMICVTTKFLWAMHRLVRNISLFISSHWETWYPRQGYNLPAKVRPESFTIYQRTLIRGTLRILLKPRVCVRTYDIWQWMAKWGLMRRAPFSRVSEVPGDKARASRTGYPLYNLATSSSTLERLHHSLPLEVKVCM